MSSKKKTTATKEDGRPALVPKLRFPEFREAEGWKEIPIGEKVDLLSGYTFDGPDITQDNSGTRLLRGINITEGRIRHSLEIDRYYPGAVVFVLLLIRAENEPPLQGLEMWGRR